MSVLVDKNFETKLGAAISVSKEKANPLELPDVPYVGLEHIEKDTGFINGFETAAMVRSTKSVFRRGDLLYGKLRPYLNKVWIAEFDGICSTDILVYPKSETVDNHFLKYRFMSRDFVNYAATNSNGVNLPRVNAKVLSEFPLWLPPLDEQRRIVSEIEKQFTRLDAGVAALQRVQLKLKRYRASVLKSACEGRLVPTEAELAKAKVEAASCRLKDKQNKRRDAASTYEPAKVLLQRILTERREKWNGRGKYKEPAAPDVANLPELPEGWIYTTIDVLLRSNSIGLKTGPFGSLLKKHEHVKSGVPVIGIENIGNDFSFVHGSKIHITQNKAAELSGYDISPGDIVVSRSGTVGELCVIPTDIGEARFSTNIMRIRLNTQICDSRFFSYLFGGSPFVLDQISELCKGSTRDFLNQHILKSLIFPLPPIVEQQRIIAEVEQRLSVVNTLELIIQTNLRRAVRLRQSILQKMFASELIKD